MRKKLKFAIAALAGLAAASLWPIITPVSGHTKIILRGEDDVPIHGLKVRQSWGVYGWGGFGGEASSTTDAEGAVSFPPRKTVGLLGARLFRRAGAFVTQCTSMLIFGKFGSGYTERWGPIVGFDIDLPRGSWLPVTWTPGTRRDDLGLPIFGDGPHRYVYLRNLEPSAPTAFVGGDALGFVGDVEVTLRLRRPTTEEADIIRQIQNLRNPAGGAQGAK